MFEQKPLDIDIFNKEEEKIVKEWMEVCKIKKKDVAKIISSWKKEKSGAGQKKQKADVGQVERTQKKFYGH